MRKLYIILFLIAGGANAQILTISNPQPQTATDTLTEITDTASENYNTISGKTIYDADNNGCNNTDSSAQFLKVKIDDGTNTGIAFTNQAGSYLFHTGQGSFTVSPCVENGSYYFTSDATVSFTDINNNNLIQNLCITPNGIHPDAEIIIVPITAAKPGFDANYKLVYRNKGNHVLSGAVNFRFNNSMLDFVNATPAMISHTDGSLSYSYTDLYPFETREIDIRLNVNAPTEMPSVNIGDKLSYNAEISSDGNIDETPIDNTIVLKQTVTGAFDPNNKQCLEGENVAPSEIGKFLHYVINFENTGNVAAQNIIVKDIIDAAKFDINSLEILIATHPVSTIVDGNKIEFIFHNINLQPNRYGNVIFKIKTRGDLPPGSSVTNKADIYFDFNSAIETNTATTVFQVLANEGFEKDQSVAISPNPASDYLMIKANGKIKSVQSYDLQGRLIATVIAGDTQTKMDISNYAKGIYFVKVITVDGMKTEKVIKK
ncbi:MAG TPA: T9SS type A sorting domain-containing protein [Flavobacterium sp.]|nr:T9SS type A sorting domain-containing protein [Flavobacterium sp.]